MKVNRTRDVENQLLVGLDIGTSTVTFVVCEQVPDTGIELLGIGESPAQGMQRGMVSNIDALVDSIKKAKDVAEQMAMREIESVFVSITGSHIRSTNSTGVVAIRGREVTTDDIDRVSEAARAVPVSSDEKLLHILSQQYVIDGQNGIRHPHGMCGVRLEAKVHVVTGSSSPIENIMKCIRLSDLEVEDVVLNSIASGQAVLTEDEKALGVVLLDIGEGTTDLAVYSEGSIIRSAAFSIAGAQITQDIAVSLHTPRQEASRVKMNYGNAESHQIGDDEFFELIVIGEFRQRRASRKFLAEVVEARLEEIFVKVRETLEESGDIDLIRSGLVLTGGSAKISDITKLASRVLNMPVRTGTANYSGELSELVSDPGFATGLGLCEYGNLKRQQDTDLMRNELQHVPDQVRVKAAGILRKLFMREDPAMLQPNQ